MTSFNAFIPVDMTLLDLNRIWGEADRTELLQDATDIPEIRDWFSVFSELGGDYCWNVIAGTSLTLINDTIPAGSASAYCEFMYWGDRYVPLWEIWDAEFAARALYEAAGTSSTEDDLALMGDVLAGADRLYGGDHKDTLSGNRGADSL